MCPGSRGGEYSSTVKHDGGRLDFAADATGVSRARIHVLFEEQRDRKEAGKNREGFLKKTKERERRRSHSFREDESTLK